VPLRKNLFLGPPDSVVGRKAARRTKFVGTGGGTEGMNARVSFGQAMADLVDDGEL
jgi:hypothetical protein